MRNDDWRRGLRFGLPGLALGAALAWWAGGRGAAAQQAAMPNGGDSNGIVAFTSPAANNSQLLYLVDTKAQSFAVYRVDPQSSRGGGSVKLEAARQFRYDLKLAEYNNQPPEVGAIETMVRSGSVKP